jgi:GNAT superfamily N-acetyltransferase
MRSISTKGREIAMDYFAWRAGGSVKSPYPDGYSIGQSSDGDSQMWAVLRFMDGLREAYKGDKGQMEAGEHLIKRRIWLDKSSHGAGLMDRLLEREARRVLFHVEKAAKAVPYTEVDGDALREVA